MSAEINILSSVAQLEAAARFLQSPFLVAQLMEGMEKALVRAHSPWLNRKDAAEYARCSTSEIDRAADKHFIQRYFRGGVPLFNRAEIDAAIRTGAWQPATMKVGPA